LSRHLNVFKKKKIEAEFEGHVESEQPIDSGKFDARQIVNADGIFVCNSTTAPCASRTRLTRRNDPSMPAPRFSASA